jgi:hypothetical protein
MRIARYQWTNTVKSFCLLDFDAKSIHCRISHELEIMAGGFHPLIGISAHPHIRRTFCPFLKHWQRS